MRSRVAQRDQMVLSVKPKMAKMSAMSAMTAAFVGIFATVVAALGVGCSGGADEPRCGNGVMDLGEECDDGNNNQQDYCRQCLVYTPPRTTITWDFNRYPERGFSGDSCIETGTRSVVVEISGPVTQRVTEQCPKRQVVFFELPPGQYQVAVTPLDENDNALVKAPAVQTLALAGKSVQFDVNVPFDAWAPAYKGLFLFRLKWGGQTCAIAMPRVTSQQLLLKVGAQVVRLRSDSGQLMDGSDIKPCREFTAEVPQSVAEVPFGPATLAVTGRDSNGRAVFEHTFETFVGVGQINPTLEFDLPAPMMPMVDAAPADAAPSDASGM